MLTLIIFSSRLRVNEDSNRFRTGFWISGKKRYHVMPCKNNLIVKAILEPSFHAFGRGMTSLRHSLDA